MITEAELEAIEASDPSADAEWLVGEVRRLRQGIRDLLPFLYSEEPLAIVKALVDG